MVGKILDVNGVLKNTLEINYDDLVWLYKDFYRIHNKYPISKELVSSNNLPQWRVLNKILKENNMTYNDFMLDVGRISHVRSSVKNYDEYIEKFKELYKKDKIKYYEDLVNNKYALPSASWMIRNCPDNTVKSWQDFLVWCDLIDSTDKNTIIKKLISYENQIGRPISQKDITPEKIGFSMWIINKYWDNFTECKKDIGLRINKPSLKYTNEEVLLYLDEILLNLKKEGRKEITLKYDLNHSPYFSGYLSTQRINRALASINTNLKDYIGTKGFSLANNGNGICYKFKDGELTKSSLEYNFSIFLRNELHLEYNKDYKRNVLYSKFSNTDRKIDCDYVIYYKGKTFYIEITGMIKPNHKKDWETYDFKSKGKNKYRDNFSLKKKLLEDNKKNYYLLFSDDILEEKYKKFFI